MDSNLSHPKFSHQLIQSIDDLCLGEKLLLLNNDFKFEVLDSVNESLDWQLPTIKLTNLNLKDNIFKSFFTLKINDKNLDKIQQINKNTLFSALVSKQVSDSDGLDLNLDIPDLPDDVSLLKWQIPNTKTFEWVDYTELKEEVKVSNEDEGFYSNKNSPFIKKERQNLPDEIWDEILTLKFSEYLNWDMKKSKERLIIGFDLNKKIDETKLFLIDSPKELFDYFYYHYLNTINIILDRDIAQHKLLIKQSNFIIDCLNCMLSLPSISFVYSRSKSKFVFNTQIQVSGVSSEALASFSEEFTQIGTQHKKILEMLKIPFLNETCGSVVRSFINSIKDYLKFYSEKIIEYFSKVSQMTIIGLYSDIKPLIDQFKCLIKIINLENFDPDEPKSYFKGSDLIFYLFDLTRQSSNNDFSYQISLHLLTGSLEPFFKFIEKWTFEGKFMDKYDQFFIDFNRDFASSRDKNYLNRVYRLKEKFKDVDERDCCFIKNLYEDIFYCGRNLALLRTCDPDVSYK
ncbi:unnamed protein product [Brachionus calyciflorus]|uniref:Gamma-tubulin complex component n=1 Tax=Brachionus calyciflorus TaxID=104777 RepID=A0A814CHN2_9BILA|nr:unnamed protein product [Brachionus calyciflorus]